MLNDTPQALWGQKVAGGPIPGNPHPFPKETLPCTLCFFWLSRWPTLSLWSVFPPWINLLSRYNSSWILSCMKRTTHTWQPSQGLGRDLGCDLILLHSLLFHAIILDCLFLLINIFIILFHNSISFVSFFILPQFNISWNKKKSQL